MHLRRWEHLPDHLERAGTRRRDGTHDLREIIHRRPTSASASAAAAAAAADNNGVDLIEHRVNILNFEVMARAEQLERESALSHDVDMGQYVVRPTATRALTTSSSSTAAALDPTALTATATCLPIVGRLGRGERRLSLLPPLLQRADLIDLDPRAIEPLEQPFLDLLRRRFNGLDRGGERGQWA